jgi:hypothetical protein
VPALSHHQCALFFCFDTLGDHDFVEDGAQRGDRADDRVGLGVMAQVADE